jgi:hypothetical protein
MRPSRGTLGCAAALVALLGAAACADSGDDVPVVAAAPVGEDATTSYPVRHVLVAVRENDGGPTKPARTKSQALLRARELAARLRAPGADFAAIARTESDDRISAQDGAFGAFVATWTNHDPVLVEAAKALPVGGVSEPVAVAQGYEILQRLSREEGKAEEGRVLIPVDVVMVPWKGLPNSGASVLSKEDAYADAARVANAVGGGKAVDQAMSEIGEARFVRVVLRRGVENAKDLADVAAKLAPGEWSGPVATPDGWAVARRIAYARSIVRHVIVTHMHSAKPATRPNRSPEAAKEIAAAAAKRVRDDPAAWEKVVAEVSDEPASQRLGGFMGEVSTAVEERVAPEIEETVLAMKPGTRDGPFATRYGYHVFWRVD